MMHLRVNNDYDITGFFYNTVIPSFTNFVFLFMTVSAFGMCCGYYEKVINQKISLSDFYAKRFKKILPFFGILVCIDVVLSPSKAALYEAFADLTLLFGFLPNAGNISVIGVGWFLGLIFVFYICFPFFCVLIQTKRRAWIAFAISIIYTFVCENYFDVGRENILYSGCFFLAGGLIYLYREKIACLNKWLALIAAAISVVLYYALGGTIWNCILVSVFLLIFSISVQGKKGRVYLLLDNPVTKFFGSISMEVYLSHMAIFRLTEKTGINTIVGNGLVQYIVITITVIIGSVMFSVILKKAINKLVAFRYSH